MSKSTDIEDLDLSDGELIRVLKNHGIDRRSVMKFAGAGAGLAALGGTAAGSNGSDDQIDEVYGAAFASGIHAVPSDLVDHDVGMYVDADGEHEGFPPVEDGPEGGPPEAFFDPVGLHVNPGEVVKFTTYGTGLHTVTSIDPKYSEPPFFTLPDRVATEHAFTSPPLAEGDSWLYEYTTRGVYDQLCLPHFQLGMVMRIVVFDPETDCIEASTFAEPEPDPDAQLPPAAGAVLDDEALDPANIVAKGSVDWADLTL